MIIDLIYNVPHIVDCDLILTWSGHDLLSNYNTLILFLILNESTFFWYEQQHIECDLNSAISKLLVFISTKP